MAAKDVQAALSLAKRNSQLITEYQNQFDIVAQLNKEHAAGFLAASTLQNSVGNTHNLQNYSLKILLNNFHHDILRFLNTCVAQLSIPQALVS
jgi:hypothetical protein